MTNESECTDLISWPNIPGIGGSTGQPSMQTHGHLQRFSDEDVLPEAQREEDSREKRCTDLKSQRGFPASVVPTIFFFLKNSLA